MADDRPSAPQPLPVVPLYSTKTCCPPCTYCTAGCVGPVPQSHWSHFKPQFAGRPDEDAEAILLRLNDWMDTYAFQDGVKVQEFCLTLVGETKLWYEWLRPIAVD